MGEGPATWRPAFETIPAQATVAEPDSLVLPPNATPLDFFQATYRDPRRSWAQRQRAAEAAAPFMHPKLAVVANLNGEGFAAALERAIARSGKAQVVHMVQPIEHEPLEITEPT